MIERRCSHRSVAVKNKLFVVGGHTRSCEVYDSTCNNFVLLKQPPSVFKEYLGFMDEVISIGSKLELFGDYRNSILFYDVEKDEWSDESCEVTNNLRGYGCAKVPQL